MHMPAALSFPQIITHTVVFLLSDVLHVKWANCDSWLKVPVIDYSASRNEQIYSITLLYLPLMVNPP